MSHTHNLSTTATTITNVTTNNINITTNSVGTRWRQTEGGKSHLCCGEMEEVRLGKELDWGERIGGDKHHYLVFVLVSGGEKRKCLNPCIAFVAVKCLTHGRGY
jgi:hypothetical protein